ncbi:MULTISPECIES: peptidoglycan -binding protein [Sulfitobacter]|uniref:peptidoglycan -binding protein n=1 Tax=Sulfitobacter TaxID=60136 RepID=UPI00230825F3|nr:MULTISPECIES: peptidoglycan -binding protein [Sulfitobacter]MDF3382280.1 peptidoglycan -binding protein [Sulfitobacter sp. Ks11]MDF3385699.1 peptidoglycan -binding protein [Sulfitobacter sp. M85]MDF3389118.1 peptidoglycan -binding protein [Sulfitobacter sp. Ks16]MDF3399755.1 peptidoglycan -binding protein [Sulfitobacter sp. KE39]MDF3403176.1 peptidoglycan -binding protein [Sulfitobacter sp. Ks35]
MALSRRTGARFQGSIWPGFVDAMTGLLLVLMFVLTIFMVVQFVLTERISGQESELNELAGEVAALSQALGVEERTTARLEARLGALNASLNDARDEVSRQEAVIAGLTSEREAQAAALQAAEAEITGFEARVAALLASQAEDQARIGDLEDREAALLDEQEALNLALSTAREEIDAQAETARLAAAKREALDALVADLRAQNAEAEAEVDALNAEVAEAEEALSAEEAARLAEAAAAQALRDRLEDADAELTAMTLSLETQRKKAEETLTLLAAARAARSDLDSELAAALLRMERLEESGAGLEAERAALAEELDAAEGTEEDLRERLAQALAAKIAAETLAEDKTTAAERRAALLAQAEETLAEEKAVSAAAQRQTELLNQQVAELRAQLGNLQALLDDAVARDAAKSVELQSLGSELNTALARVAAEERRRAELEAAERKRLEEESKNLAQYRSEFFGRLRDLLGNQEGVRIEGDRFVFSSEVLFAPGSAVLSQDGQGEIAKVAGILRSVVDDIPPEIDWVIRVDGHTDNVPLSGFGEFADNWELSQARALSVVKYMVNFLGIAPDRLAANGFGQYQPVAEGNTEAARAQNRRIELKFTEK